ncbi:MAG TPA: hypothetical protein VJI75_01680 [Candidatus Nanoarchaeia archaeon]|nr:hypothetical protein [Candidatus Nanoarchaeia archaeon]
MADLIKRLDIGIAELLLVFLITLDVLEFLGRLSPDLDYIKKIVSWACLGVLVYRANLSEIFYGYKDKLVDGLLLTSYFLLVINEVIAFSAEALKSVAEADGAQYAFLRWLYYPIVTYSGELLTISIYAGLGILLLISAFSLFMNVEVREPSLLAVLHEKGQALSVWKKIERAVISLGVLLFFFFAMFKLFVEWLGWAVDSSLTVFLIFFYVFVIIKHAKSLGTATFAFRIADASEDFYRKAVGFFHDGKTLVLGVSGMLVLHLLTELGVFVFPYLLGQEISYFGELGEGHASLLLLLSGNLASASSLLMKSTIIIIYALNVIALLSLLIGPAVLWYLLAEQRKLDLPSSALAIFAAAITSFLLLPVFRLGSVLKDSIAGADIQTQAIAVNFTLETALLSVAIGIVVLLCCMNGRIKHAITAAAMIGINVFFGYYLYLFALPIVRHTISSLIALGISKPIFSIFLALSLAILIPFYICGFFAFAAQCFRKLGLWGQKDQAI